MIDLLIKNIRLDQSNKIRDIAVKNSIIHKIGHNIQDQSDQIIDGRNRLAWPAFVESHLHLDISLCNNETIPGRTEPYLSHYGLNDNLEKRRQQFTTEDIIKRATEAVFRAARHGITAIRAQCHIDRSIGLKHLEALVDVKQACSHLVDIQIVAFPQQGLINHPDNRPLFRKALQSGIDVMGAAPNLDRNDNGDIDFRAHIDLALDLALEAGVDLDVHADLGLTHPRSVNDLEVVHLARKVIEHHYQGRVAAGHVSALGSTDPEIAKQAIDFIAEAGLHIVSQPDLYRLGRDDKVDVRRGLTRIKELLAAGVNIAYASNNVRDCLRPMGNFDLIEEGLVLAHGAHMDTVEELETILKMSTYNPARILGLKNYGLSEGSTADINILDCYSPSEAIIGQAEKRYVIRKGTIIAENHRSSSSSDILMSQFLKHN